MASTIVSRLRRDMELAAVLTTGVGVDRLTRVVAAGAGVEGDTGPAVVGDLGGEVEVAVVAGVVADNWGVGVAVLAVLAAWRAASEPSCSSWIRRCSSRYF